MNRESQMADAPPMPPHPHVHRLTVAGRPTLLVGTAHVSRESADLVEEVIAAEKPDTVCVELCPTRYEAMRQQDQWRQMDIVRVVRERRTTLLLSQLLLASFQRKLAEKFHIRPGEEMLRAVQTADDVGARVVLADREIRVTLLRAWRRMSFWRKMKMLPEVLWSLVSTEEVTEEDIEKLKQQDMLEVALKTVGEQMPELKATLIDERDQYLAHEIRRAPGEKVVAVVGAGHVSGIRHWLDREVDIEALKTVPPRGPWARSAGWIVTAALVGLFVFGFFHSGSRASLHMIAWWAAITGLCAGAGALLLLAHPLTIVASALAAPVTTLHPLLAAGWIAGLAEATLRKPQVKDFLDLSRDITSLRGFFHNKITRILLLVAFVNLTTSVGTFVAIPVIMRFLY